MKNKTWLIYKHTLIKDGPHKGWGYIGLTSQNPPNKRWKNGTGYRADHQIVFYRAIQKEGWENFAHEILEADIDSLAYANEREKYWISYYHTYIGDPECKGYNMSPGGEQWGNINFHWYTNGIEEISVPDSESCPDGFQLGRLPMSEEQREKLRNRNISADHRQQISEANSGRIAVTNGIIDKKVKPDELDSYLQQGFWQGKSHGIRRGFTHSPETLQKMRDSSPRRKLTDAQKEHLRQINLGKKQSEATRQKLSEVQLGKKWYTNGNISIKATVQPEGFWPGTSFTVSEETRQKLSLAKKGKIDSEETRRKKSEALKGKHLGVIPTTAIKVKCVETNMIYSSLSAAMRDTGFSYSTIKKSIATGQAIGNSKYSNNKVHFIQWED